MKIKELLKQHNVNITIPETWENIEEDDDEYKYHTETEDNKTIHVFSKDSYDRAGNQGKDEIIIDLTDKLITFIGADGTLLQYNEKKEITNNQI